MRNALAGRVLAMVLAMTGPRTLQAQRAAPADEGDANRTLRVHMLSGSREYRSTESLRRFAAHLRKVAGIRSTISAAGDRARRLPALESLDEADVMLVFCRRLQLGDEQLKLIKDWCDAGRPVVAVRTASHAFQTWLAFDREVLGGDYSGHGKGEKGIDVTVCAEGWAHPILAGVGPWTRDGKLYRNPRLATDASVLLVGRGDKETQPVAWTRIHRGGRVFYTSMGLPEDFQNANFLRMLTNAVLYSAGRPVRGKGESPTPRTLLAVAAGAAGRLRLGGEGSATAAEADRFAARPIDRVVASTGGTMFVLADGVLLPVGPGGARPVKTPAKRDDGDGVLLCDRRGGAWLRSEGLFVHDDGRDLRNDRLPSAMPSTQEVGRWEVHWLTGPPPGVGLSEGTLVPADLPDEARAVTTDLRGVSGVPGRFEGVLIARNAHAVVLIEKGGEGLVVVDRAAGRWVSFKTPAPIAGEHVHLFGATGVATAKGPDTRWAVGVACGGDGGPWRTDLPKGARLLWADDEMLWLGRDGQIVLRRWSVDGAREHGDALGQQEGGGPEREILLPKGPLASPVRLQPMRSCPDLAGGR